jgi:hypothetical protein
MELSELLVYLASTLDRLAVPWFLTGSTASIAWGEPRLTNDIDVVVDLSESKLSALAAAFPFPEFYLSEAAARVAVSQRGQFNIIHPRSGLKIDVIIGKNEPFDRLLFERCRRLVIAPGVEASFASPEDLILKKLEFYREGGSDKHLRDIAGILKISGERVDRAYVKKWCRELGLEDIWKSFSEGDR